MFLTNIEQIRQVNWAKSYNWDLSFKGNGIYTPLAPFNEWFPAVDVEENMLTMESYQFDAFISTYKIPKSTTLFDIKVTFADDEKHTIVNWLKKWVNITILNDDKYVSRLGDPGVVRTLMIAKLNSRHEVLHTDSYLVYPEGALYYHGSSEAAVHQMTMDFIIVGQPDKQPGGH